MPKAYQTYYHPYSTYNFTHQTTHWTHVEKSARQPGDIFTYHTNGAGHVGVYSGTDSWGHTKVYHAKGCAYGILYETKTISSVYKYARRKSLSPSNCPPPYGCGVTAPTSTKPCDNGSCWNTSLSTPSCGSNSINENYHTGLFNVHAYKTTIPKNTPTTIQLTRTDGSWKPAIVLTDTATGKILYEGNVAKSFAGVTTVKQKSGKTGGIARVVITTTSKHPITIHTTAWATLDNNYLPSITKSATYTLTSTADCQTQCACDVGAVQSKDCGDCGTQTRTCNKNCEWSGWSGCTSQGVCSVGATESKACGNCGTKTRTCNSGCGWGDWTGCSSQGVCSAGATEAKTCGNCGTKTRTCNSGCGWDAWTGCLGSGACVAGEIQQEACGNCGTRSRTCSASCGWDGWTGCTGEGSCSPGDVQSLTCGQCGLWQQECTNQCTWKSVGECIDQALETPHDGEVSCKTSEPGECRMGTLVCGADGPTCVSINPPIEEVCDGLDNDCDGSIDNDVESDPTTAPVGAYWSLQVQSPDETVTYGQTISVIMVVENAGEEDWTADSISIIANGTGRTESVLYYDSWWNDHTVIQNKILVESGDVWTAELTMQIPDDLADVAALCPACITDDGVVLTEMFQLTHSEEVVSPCAAASQSLQFTVEAQQPRPTQSTPALPSHQGASAGCVQSPAPAAPRGLLLCGLIAALGFVRIRRQRATMLAPPA